MRPTCGPRAADARVTRGRCAIDRIGIVWPIGLWIASLRWRRVERRRPITPKGPGGGAGATPATGSIVVATQFRPSAQFGLDESVQVTVEHRLHVSGLFVGAQILDQLIGRQDIGPDLIAPGVVGAVA